MGRLLLALIALAGGAVLLTSKSTEGEPPGPGPGPLPPPPPPPEGSGPGPGLNTGGAVDSGDDIGAVDWAKLFGPKKTGFEENPQLILSSKKSLPPLPPAMNQQQANQQKLLIQISICAGTNGFVSKNAEIQSKIAQGTFKVIARNPDGMHISIHPSWGLFQWCAGYASKTTMGLKKGYYLVMWPQGRPKVVFGPLQYVSTSSSGRPRTHSIENYLQHYLGAGYDQALANSIIKFG